MSEGPKVPLPRFPEPKIRPRLEPPDEGAPMSRRTAQRVREMWSPSAIAGAAVTIATIFGGPKACDSLTTVVIHVTDQTAKISELHQLVELDRAQRQCLVSQLQTATAVHERNLNLLTRFVVALNAGTKPNDSFPERIEVSAPLKPKDPALRFTSQFESMPIALPCTATMDNRVESVRISAP